MSKIITSKNIFHTVQQIKLFIVILQYEYEKLLRIISSIVLKNFAHIHRNNAI